MAQNPNLDTKQIKRKGTLNASNMTIEYWDDKSETTSIYTIGDPFVDYNGQDVEVTISIKVLAKEAKSVDEDGEILD
jgi:hypothetical protein